MQATKKEAGVEEHSHETLEEGTLEEHQPEEETLAGHGKKAEVEEHSQETLQRKRVCLKERTATRTKE